jgi:hypothetical protein
MVAVLAVVAVVAVRSSSKNHAVALRLQSKLAEQNSRLNFHKYKTQETQENKSTEPLKRLLFVWEGSTLWFCPAQRVCLIGSLLAILSRVKVLWGQSPYCKRTRVLTRTTNLGSDRCLEGQRRPSKLGKLYAP